MAKVLIVDDQNIFRLGLKTLLERIGDYDTVLTASTGKEGLELALLHALDVVITDFDMPEMNGVEFAKRLRAQDESVKIIALSMYIQGEVVREMFAAGADAFLSKDSAIEELSLALESLKKGDRFISPKVTDAFLKSGPPKADLPKPDQLSDREREILQLIAEGLSNKEIAFELEISVKTVEAHRRQVMNKLDIHSVAGLTRYAIQTGLVTL
ncbi:MAG: hypothetical protein A2508_02910 [Candidatus Lambdaproteobacteria bacterium RIFOXYD12_FULL_49_8]|uniref:DNA-binding response regulator n=1 Tax=Candidatus Lambdaproteobacteria bacterium RIFOXYD2_FULL_50_16 TaxID=1817772 RepID=A0A1F6GDL3_9PROT|nr:MAG: hypothetical protein A2527_04640 [Candidatus Lambdaproteobacteria bacterium RIFOXYD2_FULL_50_16]OGG98128.1 MAG: hypothetical protein A2508_02910 [Candidatus Lambdaproteobacteria bacterium RIFOXYD12_FULL_49_8]